MAQYIYTMNRVSKVVPPKRVILRRLVMGVGDGFVTADGNPVYEAIDMKVGLIKDGATPAAAAV